MNLWWSKRKQAPVSEKRYWEYQPLSTVLAGLTGRSYQEVDVSTLEASQQIVAVRSSVDLLASTASELPLRVYRGVGANREELPVPSRLRDPSGDGQGVEDWAYQVCVSWLLRGNLYGDIIDRGPTGMLRQVSIWHPDSVNVHLEDGQPVWNAFGKTVPAERMLHRRVNPVPGYLLGLSVIEAHAASLGLNLASTRFGLQWFKDGGHPGGILSNSEVDLGATGGESAARTAKDRFMAAMFGSREPLVLGKGWKFDQVQVAPEESQFLQTQNFSAAECARIFGAGMPEVLGYDTGSSMTYANMVDRDLALLKYAANRWIRRLERLLSEFLPRPQYVVLDRDAFLESNALERWRKHKIALETGATVINEVRNIENQPPVPWGNEPWQAAAPAAPGGSDNPQGGRE